jgi:hypothetical protein
VRRKAILIITFLMVTLSVNSAFAVVQRTSKVVSGVEYSWVVTLHSVVDGDRSEHVCTGSLIDDYTVLTAAHCLISLSNTDWVIVQGRENTDDRGRALLPYEVKIHPKYDPITSTNDLALIYLYYPAYSSSHLQLAANQSQFTQGRLSLFGWGSNEAGKISFQLREAPQKQSTTKTAGKYFRSFDSKIQIAASWYDQKLQAYAGACLGDSGGPLVKKSGQVNYLVGLVSYGARQCNSAAPTIYTKIAPYRNWINQSRAESKAKHARELSISTEPFYLLNGKLLPSTEVLNPVTGKSIQTQVQLVTGDLPNTEIDISHLTVNSFEKPQRYGSVSLTATTIGPWDACSISTAGFIEVRLDVDGKLGSDRVWLYGDFEVGCITDGAEMRLTKSTPVVPDTCKARMQTTTKGPQVWFSAECFSNSDSAMFQVMLSDGLSADLEPGIDNWMGPVKLQP